jgi:hypothetical protein
MSDQNINVDNNDVARLTAEEATDVGLQAEDDVGAVPTANPFLPADDTGDVSAANPFLPADDTGDVSAANPFLPADDTDVEPESTDVVPESTDVVPESTDVVPDAAGVATGVGPDIGEEITLKIGKSTLVSLCQNLNTNLLVNIAAYKSVLAKLKDSEKDETKNAALDSNIETLITLESNVSELLNTVQTNLNIPDDKKIDPETVIEEASSPDASSGNFMTKLLGAEAAAILGSMAAATVLMLGGGKYKRRKFTKRRQNKKQKSTKSNKK